MESQTERKRLRTVPPRDASFPIASGYSGKKGWAPLKQCSFQAGCPSQEGCSSGRTPLRHLRHGAPQEESPWKGCTSCRECLSCKESLRQGALPSSTGLDWELHAWYFWKRKFTVYKRLQQSPSSERCWVLGLIWDLLSPSWREVSITCIWTPWFCPAASLAAHGSHCCHL